MLSQSALGIQWKSNKKSEPDLTSFSGLIWYAELIKQLKPFQLLKNKTSCAHQWGLDHCAQALVLMHVAGCSNVEDIDTLRDDAGWLAIWRQACRYQSQQNPRGPSKSTLHRSLLRLDEASLLACNRQLLAAAQQLHPVDTATLDQDATIIHSDQRCGEWTYKKVKGFQPSTVTWHEKQMVVASEYRLGNVPAASGILEQLKEAIAHLPSGVNHIYYRADSASYQKEVLQYCQQNDIGFAVSGNVCREIRNEAKALDASNWLPLYDGDEIQTDERWMELPVAPDWATGMRYIIVRKPISKQLSLELEDDLTSKQVVIDNQCYRLSVIVTNRDLGGNELILWHRQRCGFGEAIHSIIKHDCAGSWTPSKVIEANATWWTIAVLAQNLHELMKVFLPVAKTKRLKSIRFQFIQRAGRITHHARRLIITVEQGYYEMIRVLSEKLSSWVPPPLAS